MRKLGFIGVILLVGLMFSIGCSKESESTGTTLSNKTSDSDSGSGSGGGSGSDSNGGGASKAIDLSSIIGNGATAELSSNSKAKQNEQAPDFTFKLDNGTNSSLSSLKGNYVAIRFWDSGCYVCIGNDNYSTDRFYKLFNGKKTASGGKLIVVGVYPEFGNYFQETKQNMISEIQAQINAGVNINCAGYPGSTCGTGLAESTIQLYDKSNLVANIYSPPDFNSTWFLIGPDGKIITTPTSNIDMYNYLTKNETWK